MGSCNGGSVIGSVWDENDGEWCEDAGVETGVKCDVCGVVVLSAP
jgi:hypothetical protein